MLLEKVSKMYSYCLVGLVEYCYWYIPNMEISALNSEIVAALLVVKVHN